ncbi:MAG TPA: primosomal protein N' [Bryobacteraceae bacterium]|nr:primosomal protein N' [Bryobacteraceae bacterium]
MARYCDVSLPVPLDRPFTYAVPDTMSHRIQAGCRVLVPFGTRRLIGMVIGVHDGDPETASREALRLVDEEPVLDSSLLGLGAWISSYYSAPLGEVLRTMVPLTGELRQGKIYSLSDSGRDAARQLLFDDGGTEAAAQVLRALEKRPLTAAYLASKIPGAQRALRSLEKRGFVEVEESHDTRDPRRASSSRLVVEFAERPGSVKLGKPERELSAYLELHPGAHSLKELERVVPRASTAARLLARKGFVRLVLREPVLMAPERGPHKLNPAQQEAFRAVHAAIESSEFRTILLHGVTGSGKTEVYLNAIDSALALGRGALLLVPEIALTPAVAGQFFGRFGNRVAILHSAFSGIERADQWRRIQRGDAPVVVGTRSGVFAPVPNLGLIVVDEEHDQSYKQEETPRYNGRDVAIVRAQQTGACVVLGSATPSLESRYNVERGKYTLITLPERIENRPMPEVEIVDMRLEFLETRKQAVFSRKLIEQIGRRLETGEQTMLLLNRRGFSAFVACRACGERIQCVNCAVTLTFHRRDRRLLCHYCNYAERVPSVCPKCNSEYLQFLGTGSEKVEEELHREFPAARIARMDRDTVTGKRQYETILNGFRERRYDILVGTQMIAKGHDIPNVTLVGVVSADVGLAMPDFRAAERTFQLLTQVAGRAGRGSVAGRVLVQTINPDHYAIRFAAAQDYASFYEKEIEFRRLMRYPPFSALANVVVRGRKQEDALRMSAELERILNPAPERTRILGPAEAPVPRLRDEFRYQLLIKTGSRKILRELLDRLRSHALDNKWPATALVIDVDPLSLL